MSEITIDAMLFIGLFPALWGLAAYLDRVWLDTTHLLASRGETKGVPEDEFVIHSM